jgi:hypothetical protein
LKISLNSLVPNPLHIFEQNFLAAARVGERMAYATRSFGRRFSFVIWAAVTAGFAPPRSA